jgi:hypothetical protein
MIGRLGAATSLLAETSAVHDGVLAAPILVIFTEFDEPVKCHPRFLTIVGPARRAP